MRNLISMLVLSSLMVALPALAGEYTAGARHNAHTQHFLSKRPHMHPNISSQSSAEQPWIGTSMVVGSEKTVNHAQNIKLHMTAKRSF